MNKKKLFLLLLVSTIYYSCNNEEQDALRVNNFQKNVTTRSGVISGTLSGSKAPYIGDGLCRYRLDFPTQSNPVGFIISSQGGNAAFRLFENELRFGRTLRVTLQKNTSYLDFDVLWTTECNDACLMVRPEVNSTIKLSADLRNIQVKMRPIVVNGPSTFELGSQITFWCSYPLHSTTEVKWKYNGAEFSKISETKLLDEKKAELKLKSIKSIVNSSVKVEIADCYPNEINAFNYFITRKGEFNCINIGPQIVGPKDVRQYNKYSYSINDVKASSFSWSATNAKIVKGQNTSSVTLIPLEKGPGTVNVTYKYNGGSDVFSNEYSFDVSEHSMKIKGPDVICENDYGTYSVVNPIDGATFDWKLSENIYSSPFWEYLNRTEPFVILDNIAIPGGSFINSMLGVTIRFNEFSVKLFKPITFAMGGIQEDNHDIIGNFFSGGDAYFELSPVPVGASDFVWRVDSHGGANYTCMQGYYFTECSSQNRDIPQSGTAVVEYTDKCGNRCSMYRIFTYEDIHSSSSNFKMRKFKSHKK